MNLCGMIFYASVIHKTLHAIRNLFCLDITIVLPLSWPLLNLYMAVNFCYHFVFNSFLFGPLWVSLEKKKEMYFCVTLYAIC